MPLAAPAFGDVASADTILPVALLNHDRMPCAHSKRVAACGLSGHGFANLRDIASSAWGNDYDPGYLCSVARIGDRADWRPDE